LSRTAAGRSHQIATANVDFLVNALDVPELRVILQQADLCLADGCRWCMLHFGMPIQERVAGADLVPPCRGVAVERMAGPHLRLIALSG
jgi:N-acetylglucosaminyldiphosphoundecaprenol N-acetyl-beta-D-mannosaminyltransferase